MKIAQIQMHVSADKAENIRHACDLVRSAGDIDLAVLPEMFCCPYDNACFRDYGEPFAGPAQRAMSHGIDMVIANGSRMEDLYGIVAGEDIGTRFCAPRRD